MTKRALALMGLLAVGCGSPYDGKSVEELVSMISTPKQAQDYINDQISYATEDTEEGSTSRQKREPNGAKEQSLRKTAERGRGLCRDGSLAVAALLQDDGYPSLTLSVWGVDKEGVMSGHTMFIYEENGRWGSAGINAADYSDPVFGTQEDIITDVLDSFGWEYASFSRHDLTLADLVEGTTNGLVRAFPFLTERDNGRYPSSGHTEMTPEGLMGYYEGTKGGSGLYRETLYFDDLYDRKVTEATADGNKTITEIIKRDPNNLTLEEYAANYSQDVLDSEHHDWHEYHENGEKSHTRRDMRERSDMGYDHILLETDTTPTGFMTRYYREEDNGEDGVLDRRYLQTRDQETGITTYYVDYDGDGEWDSITSRQD